MQKGEISSNSGINLSGERRNAIRLKINEISTKAPIITAVEISFALIICFADTGIMRWIFAQPLAASFPIVFSSREVKGTIVA